MMGSIAHTGGWGGREMRLIIEVHTNLDLARNDLGQLDSGGGGGGPIPAALVVIVVCTSPGRCAMKHGGMMRPDSVPASSGRHHVSIHVAVMVVVVVVVVAVVVAQGR